MDEKKSTALSHAVYYQSSNQDFTLLHGDCFRLLPLFHASFDMIFADPPYFLSNGGFSVQSGKFVCVNMEHGITHTAMNRIVPIISNGFVSAAKS